MNSTPTDPLTLHRGFPADNKHVWSPFVVKVEARFRFADFRYRLAAGGPLQGPKGKIPYVELADGATLGDSSLLIAELVRRGELPDLNAGLRPEQRSHDLALRALLEEKLYFLNGWEKWTANYHVQRDHILWSLPWPMRNLVGLLAYRGQMATLKGQGTGRYSEEEIDVLRGEILKTVAALLEVSKAKLSDGAKGPDTVFWAFGGENPTEVDATLFGFVASIMVCTSGPVARSMVRSHPVIVEYANRIHDKYFPDYEKWSNEN
ncbi:hypothetical protein MGG_17222 [Pyricularia oryzae 70-15]|uniref:Thioredoxin-like fold domain-containing protein n=3 Tax=Pyricularia oryzae TaxID=318829 RepID=G4N8T7_PYRO7|nr:uncharacterized protein MGG_17222 [Pyricularia oryzae 70-15]EHA51083.1 hypothetical protein MGG_17222 [Pyricularia oryzae 70-15]ELQ33423.1 hypothetical protein OOU_Y34scaffold00946g17 [Pyricularia oryzae Y34]KAI7914550.1 hypothetical protein M0657_009411 [Pyricularia oryzae]KAI7917285.1 hypothetical protein M9X92_007447 [Pyricularia oryzae]